MDNRTKIMQEALRLFYEKGYDAIGVQEIAEAAGITKPTLYHYYGSKHGLLEAVVYENFQPIRDIIMNIAHTDMELPLQLEALTHAYFIYSSTHESFFKLVMAMQFSAEGSDTHQVIHRYFVELFQVLTDCFINAKPVIGNMRGRQEQYSISFWGFLNNYMLYWFSKEKALRPDLSEQLVHEVVHQFLYGIYV